MTDSRQRQLWFKHLSDAMDSTCCPNFRAKIWTVFPAFPPNFLGPVRSVLLGLFPPPLCSRLVHASAPWLVDSVAAPAIGYDHPILTRSPGGAGPVRFPGWGYKPVPDINPIRTLPFHTLWELQAKNMILVLVTPLLFCLLLPEVWPRLNYFSLPLLLDKEFCLQLNGQANLVFMANQAKDSSLKLSSYSLTDSKFVWLT